MKYRDINTLIEEGIINKLIINNQLHCDDQSLTSLEGIQNLDLSGLICTSNYLKNLKGIETQKNLINLECGENELTNLKEIQNLIKLKYILCSGNILTNLNDLKKLVNLEILFADFNKIQNLSGIKNLINLNTLGLDNNKLIELNDLLNLTKLDKLYYYDNPCESKYKGLSAQEIVQKVFTEVHLNKDSELRGKAAAIDSGLFDFKTN